MPGYVDITMQTNQQYIALGHNTLPQMVSVISYPRLHLRGALLNSHCVSFGNLP